MLGEPVLSSDRAVRELTGSDIAEIKAKSEKLRSEVEHHLATAATAGHSPFYLYMADVPRNRHYESLESLRHDRLSVTSCGLAALKVRRANEVNPSSTYLENDLRCRNGRHHLPRSTTCLDPFQLEKKTTARKVGRS